MRGGEDTEGNGGQRRVKEKIWNYEKRKAWIQ